MIRNNSNIKAAYATGRQLLKLQACLEWKQILCINDFLAFLSRSKWTQCRADLSHLSLILQANKQVRVIVVFSTKVLQIG